MNGFSSVLQSAIQSGFSGFRRVGSGVDAVAYLAGSSNDVILVQSCRAYDSEQSAQLKRVALQSANMLSGFYEDGTRAYIHTTRTSEFIHCYDYGFSDWSDLIADAETTGLAIADSESERCVAYHAMKAYFPRHTMLKDIPDILCRVANSLLFNTLLAHSRSFCRLIDTIGAIGDYAVRHGLSEAWLDNGDWNCRVDSNGELYLPDPAVVGHEFRYRNGGAAIGADMDSMGYSGSSGSSGSVWNLTPTPSSTTGLSGVADVFNRGFLQLLDHAIAHSAVGVARLELLYSAMRPAIGAQTRFEFRRYIQEFKYGAHGLDKQFALWRAACRRFAGFEFKPAECYYYKPGEFLRAW